MNRWSASISFDYSLFLLCIMISASLPSMAFALFNQFPSADAAPEGFRTEITRADSGLARSERIQKAIQQSYLRAKLLSSKVARDSLDGKVGDIGKLSLHDAGGGFTMQVLIGTPPQALQLLVDTGSDLFWVQCSDSKEDDYFDTSSSSTFKTLSCNNTMCQYITNGCSSKSEPCVYEYGYGDGGQTLGRMSTETISLRTLNGTTRHFPKIAFGCGDEDYGFQNLDGIIGFGRGPISFTSQMSSAIYSKFSYCLRTETNTSPLFFGNAANIQHSGVQSTTMLPSSTEPSFYFVNLTGITVGGSRISIPSHAFNSSGGTILDSGTTLTFLPVSVYNRVRNAFASRIHLPAVDGSYIGLDLCYDTSSTPNYTFPSLVLQLENAQLNPPQENYFMHPDPDNNREIVCLALAGSNGLGINIIGNVMQQNYEILYDTAASTISFAPARCDEL